MKSYVQVREDDDFFSSSFLLHYSTFEVTRGGGLESIPAAYG